MQLPVPLTHASLSAGLAVFLISFHATAHVDPPEPRSKRVEELQKQAEEAILKRLDLGRGRELWAQIYAIEGSTMAICQLGQLDRRLERWEEAAAELHQCIDEMRPPRNRIERARYEARHADYAAVRRQVGALKVNVSDPGAEVLVDGRRVGLAPLKYQVFVAPGAHRVGAQLGGLRVEQDVSATAGDEQTVRLVLPEATAAATASVTAGPRVAPEAAPPARPSPKPSPPGPGPRWLTVGGLAATSAALVIFGAVAVGAANGAAEERQAALHQVQWEHAQGCPGASACGAFTAADGRAKTWTALSVGAFVGAGLAAAGAGVAVYLPAPGAPVRVGSSPEALVSVSW